MQRAHSAFAEDCTISVGTPQVPLRTVSTRVPGLRPVRTSETSTPAAISRARVASMSATRQLRPHSLSWRRRRAGLARPVHDLDDEVAAAEEHQLAPIRVRAVERHVEPEPRAVERGGALGIGGRDHDMIERGDRRRARSRPSAGARWPAPGKTSARRASASVAARVRFQRSVAPEIAYRGSRPRRSVPASARGDRAGDASCAMSWCESRCWQVPRPA